MPDPRPRRTGRTVVAIVTGVVAVFVLSLATDQLMHMLGVYPPWGEPMNDTGDNVLALGYRLIYGVVGGWIAARLAPREPMRHALVLGVIGTMLSLLGIIAATQADLGPIWYPVALALTALPCALLGGRLVVRPQGA